MKKDILQISNRRHFISRTASAIAGLSLAPPVLFQTLGSQNSLNSRREATESAYAGSQSGLRNPVCIFSKHLQWLNFDEMGAFVRDLGFGGVDLTVRKGGHVEPGAVREALPKAVRTLRKYGVDTPMMATNINDPDDPGTAQILEVASGEGIRFYRMQYYRYTEGEDLIDQLDGFKGKMQRLAELNERYGIHGAYQNHSGHYVGASVWDAWYILRGLDPEYSGMQFDIRHAVVEGGLSWEIDMELVRDYIRCTAIKDFVWEQSNGAYRVKNVPLGEGMVDFDAYFEMCRESDMSGPVSLHVEYDMFPGPEEEFSKKEKYEIAGNVLSKELEFLLRHRETAGFK